MTSSSYLHVAFLIILFSITFSLARTLDDLPNKGKGFTIELFRRGSQRSPSYNPTSKSLDTAIIEEAKSSISRLRYFSQKTLSSNDSIESDVTSGSGSFDMKLSIGTPSMEFTAILDTGSDLIWTQCQPCVSCFDQPSPIFDTSKSTTYKDLGCSSDFCNDLQSTCDASNRCNYQYSYGDQSFTKGVMATETLTFDSSSGGKVPISTIGFGCGHDNGGTFTQTAGLIGMGRGPLSLISQLGDSVDNKFSYCFVPSNEQNSRSMLKFGANAEFSGSSIVQHTPLVSGKVSTFYYLTLNDISVGNKNLNIPAESLVPTSEGGGLIIDSGTTLTMLDSNVFNVLVSGLRDAITDLKETSGPNPFALCYSVDDPSSFDLRGLPTVTFHFDGKADWLLQPEFHFVVLKQQGQTMLCSSFVPSTSVSIFGNINQQNMYVEYDLGKGVLSFAPTNCTSGN